MFARLFGARPHRKKALEIKEGDDESIIKQIEEMVAPHRPELANFIKHKSNESVLGYVRYLAKTYTDDSLSEILTNVPGLVAWQYADQHGLNVNDNSDDLSLVHDCFKDAVFNGESLAEMYELENAKELKSVTWGDLWEGCGGALEAEAKKDKYRGLNINFSDDARMLGCFMAVVLLASLLYS